MWRRKKRSLQQLYLWHIVSNQLPDHLRKNIMMKFPEISPFWLLIRGWCSVIPMKCVDGSSSVCRCPEINKPFITHSAFNAPFCLSGKMFPSNWLIFTVLGYYFGSLVKKVYKSYDNNVSHDCDSVEWPITVRYSAAFVWCCENDLQLIWLATVRLIIVHENDNWEISYWLTWDQDSNCLSIVVTSLKQITFCDSFCFSWEGCSVV